MTVEYPCHSGALPFDCSGSGSPPPRCVCVYSMGGSSVAPPGESAEADCRPIFVVFIS
uniref:Uncharacterized protein n=1 Tax=uncultured marine virus TaxID=186617 RepID=A0A0F7L4D7_9VIRU|nr:hypothetical protein [uncultured marine virus]